MKSGNTKTIRKPSIDYVHLGEKTIQIGTVERAFILDGIIKKAMLLKYDAASTTAASTAPKMWQSCRHFIIHTRCKFSFLNLSKHWHFALSFEYFNMGECSAGVSVRLSVCAWESVWCSCHLWTVLSASAVQQNMANEWQTCDLIRSECWKRKSTYTLKCLK